MPSIAESKDHQSQLNAGLIAGERTLSQNQVITFTKYVKLVLPLDGFVFWVKSDLLSDEAIYNASSYNTVPYNQEGSVVTPAATIDVQGSFHYATEQVQTEEYTIGVNTVIFTSTEKIQDFNQISSNVLYIGEFQGVRFAFNKRNSYYDQAGLHHYTGQALTSVMLSQIIDNPQDFDSRSIVVSNSLPIWLSLNKIMPMYPSYLVAENTEPVFAAVHIDPGSTQAIQAAPLFDNQSSHYQLVQDRVRITIYGLRNFNALDFVDYVNQYTLDNPDVMGISNMPTIRDEKKTQSEMNMIAMKKSIVFEVNYYQARMNDIARQLILKAVPNFYFPNDL
jgi:hypothetical protein